MSGLHPSVAKSTVYFCNCAPKVLNWFDVEYGIPKGELLFKFLGVPLISSRLSIDNCTPLIEKLTARIDAWTSSLLSFAGRVQLTKSVLFAMQSYWTNHFMLPALVHNHIQSIMTRFIWKGDAHKKGGARVAWSKLCLPKDEGGLGLKNPKEWNIAQMLIHLCKIITKHNSLWYNWVNSTALKKHHFWTMVIPTDCSGIW